MGLWGYFGHFQCYGGISVIFLGLGGILVILRFWVIFMSFLGLECILEVLWVFWSI